jgi:hypothetical protein
MRTLLSSVLAAGVVLVLLGSVRAEGEPRQVIERAIQAHGGAEKLARARISRCRVEGTVDVFSILGDTDSQLTGQLGVNTDWDFTGEGVMQLPDKCKQSFTYGFMGIKVLAVTLVVDGEEGWIRSEGKTRRLKEPELREMKAGLQEAYVATLVPLLRDDGYKLTLLDEVKVKGKPAVGVRVKSAEVPAIKLYFDKETGLLVKSERQAYNGATKQDVRQETFYTGYKTIDGVRVATRFVQCWDGKEVVAARITELKYLNKVDEGEFEEP